MLSMETAMRFFDHFGHFGHGHAGAFVAVAMGVLVAVVIGGVVAMRSQKNADD